MKDDAWRTALGPIGVWSMQLRGADRAEIQDAAAELDELGLRGLWIPGLDGKGVFADADHLLSAAPHSVVVLGVLGIWGQSAGEVVQHAAALDRAHGARAVPTRPGPGRRPAPRSGCTSDFPPTRTTFAGSGSATTIWSRAAATG